MLFGKKKDSVSQGSAAVSSSVPEKKVERKVPQILTYSYSHMGNRQYQQDSVFVSGSRILAANKKTRVLAVVCDGMGGMADGGRAAQTGTHMMTEDFRKIEKQPEVNIPRFLEEEVRRIDQVIADFPSENGHGSGSTIVAVVAEDNHLYWVSVGDSRIYVLRGNEMKQMTRDHNYLLRLSEMVANGMMTIEEARLQPQKEALISFLGIGGLELIDINIQPLELLPGDTVLLCSDGITKTLGDAQIQEIINSPTSSMEKKAETLVLAAVRGNTRSQDNTSVAILQYEYKNINRR
ncbi:MAG: serine/threonine-protein phosphatase [Eubacterium sp.]|nr:serine/threonine-protein phosphatase [Eubacterium sp.]